MSYETAICWWTENNIVIDNLFKINAAGEDIYLSEEAVTDIYYLAIGTESIYSTRDINKRIDLVEALIKWALTGFCVDCDKHVYHTIFSLYKTQGHGEILDNILSEKDKI